jgi:fermentation-respiration switch protein FrsA (DUF1100 family)
LFLPDGEGPFPGVVLQPGFGATKERFKERNPYHEVFAAAGIVSVVYDPPFMGDSDGEPRGEPDPFLMCRAISDAITFLLLHDDIEAGRVGIWGTSYSGGHVLSVASHDRRIKAVVSQAMTVSGHQNLLRRRLPDDYAAMHAQFAEDRLPRARGEEPLRATYPAAELDPDGPFTLPSFELYNHCGPAAFVHRISPTPLLMIVPDGDDLTPAGDALDAYERALEPKKLVNVKGEQYDIYEKRFPETSSAARDWFLEHLRPQARLWPTKPRSTCVQRLGRHDRKEADVT